MISKEEWIKYLCEYYDVSLEEAIELGTRKDGRKPSLPGSPTCSPVSDMTMEDIWDLKERKTPSDIFDFYIDQGAWSAFRQTIRHLELLDYHKAFWDFVEFDYSHICEYGCGVAPFTTSLLLNSSKDIFVDISLSDVEGSEHLNFAEWKFNKIISEKDMKDVEFDICPVKPNALPKYDSELDIVILHEVAEHLLSPVNTLKNLIDQIKDGGVILENFINHPPDDVDGPDLASAASERDKFYETLKTDFIIIGGDPNTESNMTRVWQKQ